MPLIGYGYWHKKTVLLCDEHGDAAHVIAQGHSLNHWGGEKGKCGVGTDQTEGRTATQMDSCASPLEHGRKTPPIKSAVW